jgi:hypothetical protein
MTRSLRACGALLALVASLPAAAQLKLPSNPPASGTPRIGAPAPAPAPSQAASPAPAPSPSAAPATASDSKETKDKESAGQLAAAGWLTLLDRRDWGTAWETSAATFRKTVPLANWLEGIPKVRADFGALQERTPGAITYKTQLERMPPGDYVTVLFVSKYDQRGEVQELVTTVREPDGRWRVIGYSPR